ncbi:DedA family protein [Demequina sp. B12]|uniref:DedA family protein n=1 Tax=Demequina sp. B12 TaxID=2992757 RepID=UPI00237B2B86|nr:DedA family protein [Demequina sp. B12]MDE0572468.1 DedA family protein [Demequina sp. B12]
MTDPTFTDWILHFSSTVENYILDFTESLWIYPGIFLLTVIDGFFPVVPSESVVIATTTAWVHEGTPIVWFIWLFAATGAWCGDQIAYLIGSKLDVRKFRIFRTPRGRTTLDWAEHALERRGTSFIIAARFIPMGRVAVNIGAGALRYPRKRFMGTDAIGAVIWATYSVALGWFFGALFDHNLLLSIVIGVIGGVVLGLLVEKILARFGITQPELPDLAADIDQLMTPEQRARAEEIERQREARREDRAERKEERHERREQRMESITGQIPIRRKKDDGDEDAAVSAESEESPSTQDEPEDMDSRRDNGASSGKD